MGDSAQVAIREAIDSEIIFAKKLVSRRDDGEPIEDFDIRGRLYGLALELAPKARDMDIAEMKKMISPKPRELSVDIAAGTGLLTIPLADWTGAEVYAIDPSTEQLDVIDRYGNTNVHTLLGSPDDGDIVDLIPSGKIDIVTSYGGLHHVSDQKKMFENVSNMLRSGGRVVAGDVEAGSILADHFDTYVSNKCITGHHGQWLSEDRVKLLTQGTELEFTKKKSIPIKWNFDSTTEMAYFFKGLHAYDLNEEEILDDLNSALGYKLDGKRISLNWPMMIFELRKK